MVQLYARVGDEFLVNTTQDAQTASSVKALPNGGFVIAWTDFNPASDGSGSSIKAQVYDGQAARVGAGLLVNTTTAAAQTTPAITALVGGGYAIIWADASSTGLTSGSDIRLQRFDAAGAKVGLETLVNATSQGRAPTRPSPISAPMHSAITPASSGSTRPARSGSSRAT